MKKMIYGLLVSGLFIGTSVPAAAQGIPVIDAANLAQAVQQVMAWQQQYQQMQQQISNTTGVRNMGNIANSTRQYLPAEYQTLISQGIGNYEAIYNAAKIFDMSLSQIANSPSGKAFEAMARQAALNRASAEMAYNQASQRFASIQMLMDKINQAPDDKDIQDLQSRIQVEQVMMQNEANKLRSLQMLTQAQHEIAMQQATERAMQSPRGKIDPW